MKTSFPIAGESCFHLQEYLEKIQENGFNEQE